LIGISVYLTGEMGEFNRVLSCCAFSWQDIPYGLVSGFCLAMAWIYLYRTLKVASSSYMTLMSMLTPVIVSLLAMVFLGETLLWVQLLGAGMIILGGVMIYSSDIVYA
jgi:uncharacterized membrane protein